MHTLWKGSISFGLVNIPVKMFTATEDKDIRFNYLHRQCKTPIKNVRKCLTCKREVAWEEVVKGYEYESGKYVLVEQDELQEMIKDKPRSIEILDFVELTEIDPIYFNKTYFLGPQEANNKAYSLLQQVLTETGKIGIATVTIRSKQSLAVVRVYQECLVMETIFYPDEVRDVNQVPYYPTKVAVQDKELSVARQLIEQLTTQFVPERYEDLYRTAIQDVVHKKISSEETVAAPTPSHDKVVDLMEALQASLEASRKKSAVTKKKKSPSSKKKIT